MYVPLIISSKRKIPKVSLDGGRSVFVAGNKAICWSEFQMTSSSSHLQYNFQWNKSQVVWKYLDQKFDWSIQAVVFFPPREWKEDNSNVHIRTSNRLDLRQAP